uniref:Uncharacterized protein n=1 Tax=Octopus bimaculoides TaxID=37653 RepID=A0A0L8G372_OCTBM
MNIGEQAILSWMWKNRVVQICIRIWSNRCFYKLKDKLKCRLMAHKNVQAIYKLG